MNGRTRDGDVDDVGFIDTAAAGRKWGNQFGERVHGCLELGGPGWGEPESTEGTDSPNL